MKRVITTAALEQQDESALNSMFLRAWFDLEQANRQRDVAQANVEKVERVIRKRRQGPTP
jgi:hypothetical protein